MQNVDLIQGKHFIFVLLKNVRAFKQFSIKEYKYQDSIITEY